MFEITLDIEKMTEQELKQYIAEADSKINIGYKTKYQYLVLKTLKELAEHQLQQRLS